MNDHDRTEDDGLAPDERVNWERQETGEEASIQVYLDDGWYWDSRKLTHPTDKELNIRIDPLTRDWYPTTKKLSENTCSSHMKTGFTSPRPYGAADETSTSCKPTGSVRGS